MKIEVHILQNFAPSCLNRDDTGSPKDCEFGGFRRARISSQCLKRAIRQAFEEHELLDKNSLAVRTKRLVGEVADRVLQTKKVDRADALAVVQRAVEGAGLGIAKPQKEGDELKTEYLLFVPTRVLDGIAELVVKNWDVLSALAKPEEVAEEQTKQKAKSKAQKKNEAQAAFPPELGKSIAALLSDGHRAPEIALFGRMIADKPNWNVDAACQVAHALSTNKVGIEFDFYTAVDDRKPDDTAGADMMGTIEFNSACFYRYALLDLDQLSTNLGGDDMNAAASKDLANKVMEAFLRASLIAVPTGKQNSMAAHNPPGFVLAVVRDKGAPWSLANAFLKPVNPSRSKEERHRNKEEVRTNGDLLSLSASKLAEHFGELAKMYGASGVRRGAWTALDQKGVSFNGVDVIQSVDDVDHLIRVVSQAAYGATP